MTSPSTRSIVSDLAGVGLDLGQVGLGHAVGALVDDHGRDAVLGILELASIFLNALVDSASPGSQEIASFSWTSVSLPAGIDGDGDD